MTDGRFKAGEHRSPATEFKPGQHWRPHKPHWDKSWLEQEYVINKRSAADIAAEVGCIENNILFWLSKHDIPRRTMSEIRAIKHWGVSGEKNPLFGKTGSKNWNFKGGFTPERQALYAQSNVKMFLQSVYIRDKFCCRLCGAEKKGSKSLHVHHIAPWANLELRFELTNVVTLCRDCHNWVHSKKNTERLFLC